MTLNFLTSNGSVIAAAELARVTSQYSVMTTDSKRTRCSDNKWPGLWHSTRSCLGRIIYTGAVSFGLPMWPALGPDADRVHVCALPAAPLTEMAIALQRCCTMTSWNKLCRDGGDSALRWDTVNNGTTEGTVMICDEIQQLQYLIIVL